MGSYYTSYSDLFTGWQEILRGKFLTYNARHSGLEIIIQEVTMKIAYIVLMLIVPLFLLAQGLQPTIPGEPSTEDVYEEAEGTNYGLGGSVGAITMNGVTYSQVRLRPELSLGKFGFGLDIDLLFDSEGNVRKEDWDDWKDYVNKIFYIRYAQRTDPLYFKVGSIPSYTLGHGLIFDHYSNMIRYPEVKNVGGYVGINLPISESGVELFTHNIHENQILAGRAHLNPFHYTQIPLLKSFKMGINIGMDRNVYGKYPDTDKDNIPDVYDRFPNDNSAWLDTDGDGIPDNRDVDVNGTGLIDHPSVNPWVDATYPNIAQGADPASFNYIVVPDSVQALGNWRSLAIYSVDYSLPLVQSPYFSLEHYGEYATIDKYGSGITFPGFASKFMIFEAKLEMRNFTDKFLPGYFDRLYDEQRSGVRVTQVSANGRDFNSYGLSTKEDFLNTAKAAVGWFGYLGADVMDLGNIKVAYQDMYGKEMNTGKSLWCSITANPRNIMNLKEASLYYSQVHAPYINFLEPRNANASVMGRIVYSISDTADLIGRYSEIYTDVNADGKIRGTDEVLSSFAFGVEFRY